jgi:hypothetical protein
VREKLLYLDFYKKGRQKLHHFEQAEINYRREDTLNFIEQNSVHEKFFYQNRTSFVGICLGKDSSITKEGSVNQHRWVRIRPSYQISHPPTADKYDFEARKWENNLTGYFIKGKLSKDFYVKFSDITITNNNIIFNK